MPARTYTVRAVQPYDLHGTLYYRILFSEGPDDTTGEEARLAHESVYANPAVGDRITVQRILNMITGVQRASEDAAE